MPDGMDDMTPEQIMEAAITLSYRSDDVTGPRDFTLAAVQALTAAGKIIVDRQALKNLLQAQVRSDKLTDQIIDELTTDTGSGASAMVTTSDAEWYDPEEQDTGS